jgi:transposase
MMVKRDLRKCSKQLRDDIHLQAVLSVKKGGRSVEEVAEIYGVSRQSVYLWIKRFDTGGKQALKSGKAKGSPRCLNPEEETILINKIKNYTPEDFKMSGMLWTREHCCRLSKKLFKKVVSLSAMGRMLRRRNMSCQKPLRRSYEQNPKLVKEWEKSVFPKILKEAKKSRASVYFSDETGVRSDSQSGTTWGTKGETPVVERTGKRLRLNVIGAMSRRGSFSFMLYQDSMTGKKFVEFLKRLMHKRRRPIILILDSLASHKSAVVKKYVKEQGNKLKVFYLPPYSPDLNPQEYGWNALKTRKISSARVSNQKELVTAVRGCLRRWQKNPNIVKGFFRAKKTLYAA